VTEPAVFEAVSNGDASLVEVMASFAAGVAVVTALDQDGVPRGLTTTAVTSVSRNPPLLLVCVDRHSRTLPAIRHSGSFVVNFLDARHPDLARRFASKAEDKFAALTWLAGTNGAPVLHEHAHAWVDCRVEREIEAGDHVVVIGEIVHGAVSDDTGRRPLTYYGRSFGGFSPHTEPSA
jgi:flavin reductase (DIM6/NTAB) family NADH-FMN oxidoreductase RutF